MATPSPATPGTPAIVVIDLVNGQFSYGGAGNPVTVNRGDPIEWSCRMGPFAVYFDRSNGTPCDHVQYHGLPAQNAKAYIRGNAPKGVYKYIVAVADPTGRIYIDDPQVIVP